MRRKRCSRQSSNEFMAFSLDEYPLRWEKSLLHYVIKKRGRENVALEQFSLKRSIYVSIVYSLLVIWGVLRVFQLSNCLVFCGLESWRQHDFPWNKNIIHVYLPGLSLFLCQAAKNWVGSWKREINQMPRNMLVKETTTCRMLEKED